MAPIKYIGASLLILAANTVIRQQDVAADRPQTVPVTDQCLDVMNAARAAKLDVREGLLSKESGSTSSLESEATKVITGDAIYTEKSNITCATNEQQLPAPGTDKIHALILPIDNKKDGQDFKKEYCATLMQQVIEDGLNAINGDTNKKFDELPYNNQPAAQNFGYLMLSSAKTVGCVVTSGCTDTSGVSLLVCKFSESFDQHTDEPPFTPEFYAAVKARYDAHITLSQLGKDDLNKPLTESSPTNEVPTSEARAESLILSILSLIAFPFLF